MTTLEERYQKGMAIRGRFRWRSSRTRLGASVPGRWRRTCTEIADEALFGSIWQRPGLKIEHREMCTLSVLTVLQRENQLARHCGERSHFGG